MKVTLIDYPKDIVKTFSQIWSMSKTDGDWENVKPDDEEFMRMLDADVPVMRFAMFIFIIEDMPVFFREQLVRAKHEDFWIQSMRVADLTRFGSDTRYHIPKELTSVDTAIYAKHMQSIGALYCYLKSEYSEEIARRIMPLATLHRGAWFTNLQALVQRFKKRSCWIAEDTWVGFLAQVRQELITKVHPIFQHICSPPCFKPRSMKYEGCSFEEIMKHRMAGKDPLPLCPLWAWKNLPACDVEYYDDPDRANQFAVLWGRDPRTGTLLSK